MDRKKQLVQEAIRILAVKGVKGLTIRNLAQAVGITDGAIYRHFKNKRAILEAILERFDAVTHHEDGDAWEDPVVEIQTFLEKRYRRFEENPALAKLLFLDNIFQGDPELLMSFRAMMHRHIQTLEQLLKAGQEQGVIKTHLDTRSLFRLIIGPFRLIVTQWVYSGFSFNLKETGLAQFEDTLTLISA